MATEEPAIPTDCPNCAVPFERFDKGDDDVVVLCERCGRAEAFGPGAAEFLAEFLVN